VNTDSRAGVNGIGLKDTWSVRDELDRIIIALVVQVLWWQNCRDGHLKRNHTTVDRWRVGTVWRGNVHMYIPHRGKEVGGEDRMRITHSNAKA
jgi:hypothetical protein